MVHGACRARPDAAHAVVTAFRVDNVVPLVADRLGGAARLARIAPDAGFRVDQMLPKWHLLLCACFHVRSTALRVHHSSAVLVRACGSIRPPHLPLTPPPPPPRG